MKDNKEHKEKKETKEKTAAKKSEKLIETEVNPKEKQEEATTTTEKNEIPKVIHFEVF